MEAFHQKNKEKFALRLVDINRAENKPGAGEFGFRYIPHLIVYSPQAKLLADGTEASLKEIGFSR